MKKLFVIIFLIILPVCSFASEKPVWTQATGEAYLGEIDTPKEVKGRAKIDAQKNALEQAVGVFIKSHTLVSNSQLAEDLVYASVRGQIERTEILHEGWDKQKRSLYRVTVRTLIKPVYPEKGKGLFLKAYISKTGLKEGEEVRIFYEASSDCYVYIFSVAADGSVTLLLPNSIRMENLTRGRRAYEFPTSGSEVRLKAMFLPGYKGKVAEERIKLIATKEKKEILSLGFHEGMFKAYDSRSTGMISDLVRRLNRIDPAKWTEATAIYTLTR